MALLGTFLSIHFVSDDRARLILSYGAERLQPTPRMHKEGEDEKKERVREEEKIGSYVRVKEASGHQSQS